MELGRTRKAGRDGSPRESFFISELRQLDGLRSSSRYRILETLISLGPSTVREIAEHQGLIPESVYYHIKTLIRLGLVVDLGKRPAKRRPESVFQAISSTIRIDPEKRTPRFRRALASFYDAVLRSAGRGLRRALEDDRAERAGPQRNCLTFQVEARLSPQRLQEWNRRVDELCSFMFEDDDEGEVIHMTISAHPLERE